MRRHPLAPVARAATQRCLHLQSSSTCWPRNQLTLVSSVAGTYSLQRSHTADRVRLRKGVINKGLEKIGLAAGIRHRAQSDRPHGQPWFRHDWPFLLPLLPVPPLHSSTILFLSPAPRLTALHSNQFKFACSFSTAR